MKNQDLMKKFLRGDTTGKTGSMRIHDDKLFSYDTVIAQRTHGRKYFLNVTRYSVTTSKQRNQFSAMLYGPEIAGKFDGVPIGESDLAKYAK